MNLLSFYFLFKLLDYWTALFYNWTFSRPFFSNYCKFNFLPTLFWVNFSLYLCLSLNFCLILVYYCLRYCSNIFYLLLNCPLTLKFLRSSFEGGKALSISLHISFNNLESDIPSSIPIFDSCRSSKRVLYLDFFSICESLKEDSDYCILVMLNPCSSLSCLLIFL